MFRKKKIAVALSGGAARGLCHIGVLEVLEGMGVRPDIIAGTSMGAIIGSFYCSGTSLKDMREYVESMDWRSFLLFSDIALSKTGMINGKKVLGVLRKFLDEKTFDDCSGKFCCVAVDLFKREKVVLTEGKLLDAVRASISIPGFFAPVLINNMFLVDGGIIEPLPTESARELGADIVIASTIAFEKDREKYRNLKDGNAGRDEIGSSGSGKYIRILKNKTDRKNIKGVSVQSIIDTSLNIMEKELKKESERKADIVISSEVGDFGFFDLIRGREIIERGRAAAESKAELIKNRLRLKSGIY
jgi:NTE family protein